MTEEEREQNTHWAETNPLCLKCVHECKQSKEVEIIICPQFESERKKKGDEKIERVKGIERRKGRNL